jgi:hypothetical protein
MVAFGGQMHLVEREARIAELHFAGQIDIAHTTIGAVPAADHRG